LQASIGDTCPRLRLSGVRGAAGDPSGVGIVSGEQSRIVVVNDDATQLRLVSALLETEGHQVTPYLDSEEALRALQGAPPPELVVLDLHMPGIDGWRFCRLLRSPDYEAYNRTPVLVVSATFTGTDVEAVTAELGANAFLPVPFSPETLRRYVTELLAGRRPSATLSVLVVDDERAIRELLRRVFSSHGYRVEVASTGVEGRSLARRMRPDILVVDHHLPDIPGDSLLSSLKRPGEAMVGILMTGDSDPGLALTALRKGADAYVRKPFDPSYLVDVAQKARRERSLLRVEEILESRTRELRSSESRYRSLFATIPEPILVLDESGRILQSNQVAERLLGLKAPDLFGTRFRSLVSPARVPDLERGLGQCWADGSGEFETTLVARDGTSWEGEVTARVVDFQGGKALLTVSRDVTERRQAERERERLAARAQHAQKLESLGVLAGGIAHDFNNLLVGILGNASFALMDLTEDHPAWESVKQVEVAARRAAELTSQILTYSGRAQVSMRPVDIATLIREMGQLLEPAVSRKALLRYELAPGLPAVLADPGQLRQVVMNLVMNASDALEGERGSIEVRTSLSALDSERLRAAVVGQDLPEGHYVVVQVTDTGGGMDAETLRKIFDPFFTTKFTGRGLGLAAVMGIVRSHGGGIMAESEPGRGSSFSILLPPSSHPVPHAGPEAPAPLSADGVWKPSGTVLVVDEEAAVRSVARATLERVGFRVLECEDGREAVRLFQLHRLEMVAVLVDLSMPELSGEEVLLSIRSVDPGIRVILSSGFRGDEMEERLMQGGADALLWKPYGSEELLSTLHRLITSRQGRDRTREGSVA